VFRSFADEKADEADKYYLALYRFTVVMLSLRNI